MADAQKFAQIFKREEERLTKKLARLELNSAETKTDLANIKELIASRGPS